MQNTFKLLQSLAGKGISVSLVDGLLKVVPKELLNDELRAEIRTHKSELVDALLSVNVNELDNPQEVDEIARPSCWGCHHYDGKGTTWPGMCRYFEFSGKDGKDIDFNAVDPTNGCQFFAQSIQDVRKVPKVERLRNNHSDPPTTDNVRRTAVKLPSPVALAWLEKNKAALLCNGWTAAELYRRNKSCRGIAWLGLWQRTDLEISLLNDGIILFCFKEGGAPQTARPKKHTSLVGV